MQSNSTLFSLHVCDVRGLLRTEPWWSRQAKEVVKLRCRNEEQRLRCLHCGAGLRSSGMDTDIGRQW